MKSIFQVDPSLDVPIYQQLADRVRMAARMGTLRPGQQLPTVQELANTMGLAKGTIKRAYDELELQGVLEKIQGRGTFVCYQPANSDSRKEQAMAAIDDLLDKLEGMGFSQTEIGIFLNLKQRERTEKLSALKVALVECNPECLSYLAEQLRSLKDIDLCSYLLKTVEEYPYNLDEDMDLVITTGNHGEYIESILPDRKKLALVALQLSLESLAGIVRLRPGERVGILSGSARFGELMLGTCKRYTQKVNLEKPRLFSPELNVAEYLKDKDVVLAPKGYERYCSPETARLLQRLEKKGKLILCSYELDEGSMLHLEEKLKQIQTKKKR
ncbi:MAG: GntR family transcriptional regulator [Oscillospiraceae bacterium]|nr:GntR family transcriptional regulator [Oscillospiraceae bacterium]